MDARALQRAHQPRPQTRTPPRRRRVAAHASSEPILLVPEKDWLTPAEVLKSEIGDAVSGAARAAAFHARLCPVRAPRAITPPLASDPQLRGRYRARGGDADAACRDGAVGAALGLPCVRRSPWRLAPRRRPRGRGAAASQADRDVERRRPTAAGGHAGLRRWHAIQARARTRPACGCSRTARAGCWAAAAAGGPGCATCAFLVRTFAFQTRHPYSGIKPRC